MMKKELQKKTSTSKRYIPYREQLKDVRWKRKAEKIKSRDDFVCQICGTDSLELNVHHLFYISGYMAWEYPDDCLLTVCYSCHEKDLHGIFKNVQYAPCVCHKCKMPITNKNCNTIERIGDYYRFNVFCDRCSIKRGDLHNG